MKNRTVYEVLDKVMEDYSYSIKKAGRKVEITGSVYISRLDMEVTHEKIFYYASDKYSSVNGDNGGLAKAILSFKSELKDKVAKVISEHKDILTDDDAMIKKLLDEVSYLKETLNTTETELKAAKERIHTLELEKLTTVPYTPWSTGTTPWITWDNGEGTGKKPDYVWKPTITCEHNENSEYSAYEGFVDSVVHPEKQ